MPSPTEVVNDALDEISSPPISDIDNTDAKSQRCKRIYDIELGAALKKTEWNFANKHLSIAKDATAPIERWLYSYTIPPDCVQPIRLNDDDTVEWAEDGGKIYTDAASPIILEYTRLATNPTEWSAMFLTGFSTRLQARFAAAFKGDPRLASAKRAESKDDMNEAEARDGQTGTIHAPGVPTLTTNVRRF